MLDFIADTQWSEADSTSVVCPQCGAINRNNRFKYHKYCKTLQTKHLHIWCYACEYNWGTYGKYDKIMSGKGVSTFASKIQATV